MNRMLKSLLSLLLAFILCTVLPVTATAAGHETAEATIPVIARGAACTAELIGEDGRVVQTLALEDGKENQFHISCDGLGKHHYSLRLKDKDTESVIYDKTVYLVSVELFLNEDDKVYAIVTALIEGDEEATKPDELYFENTDAPVPTPAPAPTPPTPAPTVKPFNPKTGDESRSGLWAAMAAVSLAALGGLGSRLAKDRKKKDQA